MKRKIVLLAGFAAWVSLSACSDDSNGSTDPPQTDTEIRTVLDFDAVFIVSDGIVTIEHTGTESLAVTAEVSVLPDIRTEVVENVLVITYVGTKLVTPLYQITVDDLVAVTFAGRGNVQVTGVNSSNFDSFVTGLASMTLTGTAANQQILATGQSIFDALDLQSSVVDVGASGFTTVKVRVSSELNTDVNAPATVQYIGSPTVTENGSGQVNCIAECR